jgi:histidinol-phosphate aminotransferase
VTIEALARPEIAAMKPYSSARSEAPGRGILLNANESPWPLLDEGEPGSGLNRYPDPQPGELRRRLATLYGVEPECLLVTRGSDEGIDLLTRVFCAYGKDAVLHCPPTFGMYRIAAQTQGVDLVAVPRDERDFSLDRQRVLDTVRQDARVKLIFLTSPNNPTGDILTQTFLEKLLDAALGRALVVVDEAYIEFSSQPSASSWIGRFEHLVVLRTLSKAWASAGLRCGSVLARPSVIGLLRRVIAPYPLPSPVTALAFRMLDDAMLEQQQSMLRRIAHNKQFLLDLLHGRSFIRDLFPGEANFVLMRVDDADGLLGFCLERNIVLRGFPSDPALAGCIRISVGSEEELAQLETVLNEWESRS